MQQERARVPGKPVGASPAVTRAQAPTTCGEMIQGTIDGRDFLVNCPIDRFALATVSDAGQPGLQVRGTHSEQRAAAAIHALAASREVALRERLEISGGIPRVPGMGSGTAAVSAAVSAFCRHRDLTLAADAFGALVASIEPAGCVHHRGIAEIDPSSGRLHALWPAPRGLRVLVLDAGGAGDDVTFDPERARAIYTEHRGLVQRYLGRLRCGLMLGALPMICEAATMSGRLAQRILHRPAFQELSQLLASTTALGVNCAHRGTVFGVLYEERPTGTDVGAGLRRSVGAAFGADLAVIGDHQVVGGGCQAVW